MSDYVPAWFVMVKYTTLCTNSLLYDQDTHFYLQMYLKNVSRESETLYHAKFRIDFKRGPKKEITPGCQFNFHRLKKELEFSQ